MNVPLRKCSDLVVRVSHSRCRILYTFTEMYCISHVLGSVQRKVATLHLQKKTKQVADLLLHTWPWLLDWSFHNTTSWKIIGSGVWGFRGGSAGFQVIARSHRSSLSSHGYTSLLWFHHPQYAFVIHDLVSRMATSGHTTTRSVLATTWSVITLSSGRIGDQSLDVSQVLSHQVKNYEFKCFSRLSCFIVARREDCFSLAKATVKKNDDGLFICVQVFPKC